MNDRTKGVVIRELENAKMQYSDILDGVKLIDKQIKYIDATFVQPLKESKKLWGFTLFAGTLPLETLELTMRLEACIKQLDTQIKKTRKLEVTA